MRMDEIAIRRLDETKAADAELYRTIRLEALRVNPEAFSSSLEVEAAQLLSWFSARLGGSTVLGGFRDGELVAIAGFAIQQGPKNCHKGTIWGLYVRPHARAAGIGRRLFEAILDQARHHVERVQLAVVSDNLSARRLYESLGFVAYGHEKDALRHAGRGYDNILMAKDFSAAKAAAAGGNTDTGG